MFNPKLMSLKTKEGCHEMLKAILDNSPFPLQDRTDFSQGSKVHAASAEHNFSVVVSKNRGVQPLFAGYGWKTTLTPEQQRQVQTICQQVNNLVEFPDLWGGMSNEERENWKGWANR